MPTINQKTQTAPFPAGLAESEAEMGAWGSWGFRGGPGQGGRARHLGIPRPQCPRGAKHCSTEDVVLTPFLPIQPLPAPGKGPGGGDGWWPWSPGCWAAASLI